MGNENRMERYDFFKSIVQLTSDIIWEVDENWHYTYISRKYNNYLGYSADEIIGRTPFSLMSEKESEKYSKILHCIASEKKNITDIELKFLNKQNKTVYLMINAIPLIDSDDTLTGYRGVARDITDKKLIEEALTESESHLSALMNNLPGLAYRGTLGDKFVPDFISDGAYQLTGYRQCDFLNNKSLYLKIIHPDDLNEVSYSIKNSLKISTG